MASTWRTILLDRRPYYKYYDKAKRQKRHRERAEYFRFYRKTHVCKGGEKKNKELPFRVWDCEGRTFPDGSHAITLLANSDNEYIEDPKGLRTLQCLDFLTRTRSPAINVWFAFTYDVTQILRDVPFGEKGDGEFGENTLAGLWERTRIQWMNYRIRYVGKKFFHVKGGEGSFRSFDTFGFFQTSFLEACATWNIDASQIEEGKKNRSRFMKWSMKRIREYNFAEMALLKSLVSSLRKSLQEANLEPKSWHGPGAIAHVWLQREGIRAHYPRKIPSKMDDAIGRAYFGGRIDISTIGEMEVERYDIVSAYPAGLSRCISLSGVEWRYNDGPSANDEHALYHIAWYTKPKDEYSVLWHPFPWRTNDGTVLFPDCTKDDSPLEGWYWGVEVLAAERLFPGKIQRLEAWYPIGDKQYCFQEPIRRDFEQRRVYKRQGNPAEKALKLALNSLYGKLCQHQASHSNISPQFQNFIWAGFVTAYTRAKILDAIAEVGQTNVYSVMTDGILTRKKLHDSGKGLGDWEYAGSAISLIVAAGLYGLFDSKGCKTTKQRGLPAGINFGYILRTWGCRTRRNTPGPNVVVSKNQRYIGIGQALMQNGRDFGRFVSYERKLRPVVMLGTSKRRGVLLQTLTNEEGVWDSPSRWTTMKLLTLRPRQNETAESPLSRPYRYLPEWKDELTEEDYIG